MTLDTICSSVCSTIESPLLVLCSSLSAIAMICGVFNYRVGIEGYCIMEGFRDRGVEIENLLCETWLFSQLAEENIVRIKSLKHR